MPRRRSRQAECLRLAISVAMVALLGCKGAGNLPMAPQLENPSGPTLFSLEIRSSAQAVGIGQQLPLEIQGRDDRDTPIEVTPTWRSSDESVAAVDARGVVTGRKAGQVTITATTQAPPREATLRLSVGASGALPTAPTLVQPGAGLLPQVPGLPATTPAEPLTPVLQQGPSPPPGYGLAIYPAVPRVAPGGTLRMLALQGPSGFETPAAAVWRSANAAIATIDDAGMVTGVKAGTVRILAQSVAYPGLVREVEIAVIAPAPAAAISSIRIRPSRVVMNVGESFWLQAEVSTFSGGVDPLVRWESGNPAVVSVSAGGELTALAPGKTTITAYAAGSRRGDLSASVPVEVRNSVLGRIRDLF